MKSKVKFGLGSSNKEVIIASVVKIDSDDVRDRIAHGFFEGMGYDSNICYLNFWPSESGCSNFEIYPIKADLWSCEQLAKSISTIQMENIIKAFEAEILKRQNTKSEINTPMP
jgi:hypothetical protein